MNVIAIEAEGTPLDNLEHAIRMAEPRAKIRLFRDAESALEWPNVDRTDIAFMNIDLPGINGIDAARLLQERNAHVNIIFTADKAAYMKDAFDIHASGFILKPVDKEKVRHELDCLRYPPDMLNICAKLQVRCFGNFEVFADGKPLVSLSGRALELFAYLVDRRGARCSVGEIEAVLWDSPGNSTSRQSYLRELMGELARCFAETGYPDVIMRQYGYVGLNTTCISCDYWDYLDNTQGEPRVFHGEYMEQYSWAEPTRAVLLGL